MYTANRTPYLVISIWCMHKKKQHSKTFATLRRNSECNKGGKCLRPYKVNQSLLRLPWRQTTWHRYVRTEIWLSLSHLWDKVTLEEEDKVCSVFDDSNQCTVSHWPMGRSYSELPKVHARILTMFHYVTLAPEEKKLTLVNTDNPWCPQKLFSSFSHARTQKLPRFSSVCSEPRAEHTFSWRCTTSHQQVRTQDLPWLNKFTRSYMTIHHVTLTQV